MLISTVSPGGSPPIYNSRWRLPHFLQIRVQYACAINPPAALRARESLEIKAALFADELDVLVKSLQPSPSYSSGATA